MKITSRLSVACCGALLIVVVVPGVRAASNTLVLSEAEPQYASKLCWAAADVLAVNQFYVNCPTPTKPNPPLLGTSQSREAAYNESLMGGSLSWWENTCEQLNIQECDDWGLPRLQGLNSKTGFTGTPATTGTNTTGLTWEAVKQEIDAGRPFLFRWVYSTNGTSSTSPVGPHQLVATGYSDEKDSVGTRWLQIWDPWPIPPGEPVSQVPACGPAPGVQVTNGHSRWTPFSNYSHPVNDMGVPVTAVHKKDQWQLEMLAPQVPEVPQAPTLFVDHGTPPPPPAAAPRFFKFVHPASTALPKKSFAEALRAAVPQSRQLELQVPGAAPRSLGVPFPIVGLGFVQLLGARDDPTRLLAGTTSAILFPVESQGEVVDAFLMLFMQGRWQRGGYANLEITQRLVDVRARYAAPEQLPLDSFYMVSVPGEVAFFAAYGNGKKAVLIPASTDPSIGAVAGEAMPAAEQLLKLIAVIEHDLQRHPDRGDDSARRNGSR
jgi:hypothetical protein